MDSSDWKIVLGILSWSSFFIYQGIVEIKKRSTAIGGEVYKGWSAIAPAAIKLLLGFAPLMILLDFSIPRIFGYRRVYPIMTLLGGAITLFLIFYSYAKKDDF